MSVHTTKSTEQRSLQTYTCRRLSAWPFRSSLASALRVPGGLGEAACVDGWAGVDVGAHFRVDVDEDAWVGVLVSAGE
jgi:hypothetical protein